MKIYYIECFCCFICENNYEEQDKQYLKADAYIRSKGLMGHGADRAFIMVHAVRMVV
jgi:hypothetical protein